MEPTLTNLEYLYRFCKEDRSRMERYVNMYIQGSPVMYEDLRSKLAVGDVEGMAVAPFSLAGQRSIDMDLGGVASGACYVLATRNGQQRAIRIMVQH